LLLLFGKNETVVVVHFDWQVGSGFGGPPGAGLGAGLSGGVIIAFPSKRAQDYCDVWLRLPIEP
jgi:hypothetical protein